MNKETPQNRLKALFGDLKHLSDLPDHELPAAIREELAALQSRLVELEAQIQQSEPENNGRTSSKGERSAPLLYEAEQISFIYKNGGSDQLEAINPSSAILLDHDHTLKTPLTASGQTIGSMQVESSPDHVWTSEDISLANTVAQQVSLQIQNLQLLAATERARQEAETATRQFMHKGWDSYLDAIHQNERIGYSFDQSSVSPCLDAPQTGDIFQEAVKVMEEHVGTLSFRENPNHPLTNEDKLLITAVASRVAEQVESIRLLAEASRARASAEEATRLLTRKNWDEYTGSDENVTIGFAYDTIQVSPLGTDPQPAQNINFEQPLVVQGESIGRLTIAGLKNITAEAKSIAEAIAVQTSIHLETLRLTEQLQKRARELQELDRLKSAFLANMSHELRTPLNSILGFSDVMLEELDGPLTDNMKNDLGLIQKNGQHLLHLINDVLDMAKIESGKMNLIIEKFPLQEIFEEVTSIISPLASEKNLALFIEPDTDKEVAINADRTRLRQVMINLVNNAMKFTEKGSIAIRATQEESNVRISVHDTGIGIPVNQLEDVFQEFTQVDTSTTRKVGGTGLGLPISRKLIEMHGGKLWAESSGINGEGSTFFILLPIEAKVAKDTESEPRTRL